MKRTDTRTTRWSFLSLALGAALLMLAGCGRSEKRSDEVGSSGEYASEEPGAAAGEQRGTSDRAYRGESGAEAGDRSGGMGELGEEGEWESGGGTATPMADRHPSATATLQGARGHEQLSGTAAFVHTPEGLQISLRVTGAQPGEYGVHIHETGSCDQPDFKSAGEHYNPQGHKHGLPTEASDQRHIGDLGNVTVAPDGKGTLSLILDEPNLKADDEKSFIGKAIIVHGEKDTGAANPSAPRIACGVIQQGGDTTSEDAPERPAGDGVEEGEGEE